MIHYHVWFNLKPGIPVESGVEAVSCYLSQLSKGGETAGFQLLRNLGASPRSKLPAYHALIEFADSDALGLAMKKQAERGIHSGAHGRVVDAVCDFQVEIFTSISTSRQEDAFYACEL